MPTWTPSHSSTTVSLTCACLGTEMKSSAVRRNHMSAHAKLQMPLSTPGAKTSPAVSFQDLAQTLLYSCCLNLYHLTRSNQNNVFQISIQGTIRHSGKKVVDICVHHITPLSSMYLKPHVDWLKWFIVWCKPLGFFPVYRARTVCELQSCFECTHRTAW